MSLTNVSSKFRPHKLNGVQTTYLARLLRAGNWELCERHHCRKFCSLQVQAQMRWCQRMSGSARVLSDRPLLYKVPRVTNHYRHSFGNFIPIAARNRIGWRPLKQCFRKKWLSEKCSDSLKYDT